MTLVTTAARTEVGRMRAGATGPFGHVAHRHGIGQADTQRPHRPWRANFHGLRFEPTNLVVFINALVNDAAKPHGHEQPSTWDSIKKRLRF